VSIEQDNRIITEIWDTYYPRILALCKLKLMSYPEEVDDVAAEIFDSLVNESRIRKLPDKIDAWLYKVAYNKINQKYKEMYKRKKFLVNVDFSDYDETEKLELKVDVDMDDERIDDEDIESMKEKLIKELTEEEQQLIFLVCEQKLKLKEIADIMNSTETAVRQKFYRTKRKAKIKAKKSIENFK